uniref:Uncharacterized protein n=1 Tax=Tanacetum cinerariifolium TaxID=118510 RepID=A0A6L2JTA6_TANCI|nr:hypothetical protein [Tanacetum cinerariifolium]
MILSMENPEQAFVDYASSRNDKVGRKQFTTNQRPRNFNETANAWKEKPNFNWALTQTFISPQNGTFSTYSSSYQTKLKKALGDFDSRGSVKPNSAEYKDHKGTIKAKEKVEEKSEEEFKEETEEEIEEEVEEDPEYLDTFPTTDELRYHELILKNPQPPWVSAKIRTRDIDNIKIECMVGRFLRNKLILT